MAPGPGLEEVEGLKIKLIDTCGLEDPEAGDTVHHVVRKGGWHTL